MTLTKQTAILILYCLCLQLIIVFAYRRPLYNWDMLGYMALIIQKDHKDVKEIHQLTYQEAKQHIPAADFEHLIGGDYRKGLAENPHDFFGSLPFYAVKPLYIEMASLLHKLGFTLPMATVIPSILFYFLIGLLVFHWLSKYVGIGWTFFLSLCLMYSGMMVFLARVSTPDALSAFLLLSAFYFILVKPSRGWLFFFLALSVFARLDNIVPSAFILSFLFFSKSGSIRINLKTYILLLAILAGSYFAITTLSMRPFGWSAAYYNNFALHLDLSHGTHTTFPFKAYSELVISQLATALVSYNIVIYLFVLLLLLYSRPFSLKSLTEEQRFCLLLLGIIAVRFVLYPDLSDRFNIAYYLCFLMLLVKRLATR